MDEDLVRLRVGDVKVAVPAGNGVEAGLVVLEEVDEPNRRLQIFVGQPEARAIQVAWTNTVPPRPSTWDLFVTTVSILDARISRAVITDVEEERHYFAQLVVYRAGQEEPLLITARPSDALALALRAYRAEILAAPHVLDEAGLLADGTHWVRPPAVVEPEVPDEDDEAVLAVLSASQAAGAGRRTRRTSRAAAARRTAARNRAVLRPTVPAPDATPGPPPDDPAAPTGTTPPAGPPGDVTPAG